MSIRMGKILSFGYTRYANGLFGVLEFQYWDFPCGSFGHGRSGSTVSSTTNRLGVVSGNVFLVIKMNIV